MALSHKPPIQFHQSLERLLKQWKQDPAFDYAILSYGRFPQPYALIAREGVPPIALPMPVSPNPFIDWNRWFCDWLEPQVRCVCDDNKVTVYVQTRKGNLVLLEKTLGE